MNLLINTRCNLKCDYCFHGKDYIKRKDIKTEMSIEDIKKLIKWTDFLEVPNASINFLGGEPTQHSQFSEILDLLDKYPVPKFIMTNGIVPYNIFKRLVDSFFAFLINISTPLSDIQKETLEKNLESLNKFSRVAVSINLQNINQNIKYELYLIKKYKIKEVYINLPAPGRSFSNKFNLDFSQNWGDKMYKIMLDIHNIDPQIEFNTECCIPGCYTTKEVHNIFKEKMYNYRTTSCEGAFDIYPDMHSHWCPALENVEELRIDNIFEYENAEHLHSIMKIKYDIYRKNLGVQCTAKDNNCYTIECDGPCAAYNLALKTKRAGQIIPMESLYN